jgi:alkanesulfonate monooxygenase SsuD/methylene tetrahydromethanopterin reductase-like flavin-dependent oxidoreductase (luciferase family)
MAAAGRDPGSLEITVGVNVVIPDLATAADELPARAISGALDELAAGIRGYADAGVGHLICAVTPTTEASMARLAEATRRARE